MMYLEMKLQLLVNEDKYRGIYNINFNGSNLASGVYFYQLRAGQFYSDKKNDVCKIKLKKFLSR